MKTDARLEQAFKRAVWTRDKGICRVCGRKVIKSLELVPNRGEVHHLRGRRVAPEDRFTVARAVLVCAECHPKVQRGAVKVPGLNMTVVGSGFRVKVPGVKK